MSGFAGSPNIRVVVHPSVVDLTSEICVTATNSTSSFYASSSLSSSYAVSASHAAVADIAYTTIVSVTSSLVTSSFVTSSDSSSWASYSVLAGNAELSETASFAFTASFAQNAETASYVPALATASYANNAGTASVLLGSIQSASFAATSNALVNPYIAATITVDTPFSRAVVIRAVGLSSSIAQIGASRNFAESGVSTVVVTNPASASCKILSIVGSFEAAETAGRAQAKICWPDDLGATSINTLSVRPEIDRVMDGGNIFPGGTILDVSNGIVTGSVSGYTGGEFYRVQVRL